MNVAESFANRVALAQAIAGHIPGARVVTDPPEQFGARVRIIRGKHYLATVGQTGLYRIGHYAGRTQTDPVPDDYPIGRIVEIIVSDRD